MLVNVSSKETGELLVVDTEKEPGWKKEYNHANGFPFEEDSDSVPEEPKKTLDFFSKRKKVSK